MRRGWPVAEHEAPAAKRIVSEHLLADPRQAVDPLALMRSSAYAQLCGEGSYAELNAQFGENELSEQGLGND
jgi:hypothetical protein